MRVDQAAGLRAKRIQAAPAVASVFGAPPAWILHLAQGFLALQLRVLLVDSQARHARGTNTQFIFSWQNQLAQHRLQTLCVEGLEIMPAPGAQAGDPAIVALCKPYHVCIFDGYELAAAVPLAGDEQQVLIVTVDARTIVDAYALIKTLHLHRLDLPVILLGDLGVTARVIDAVNCFLPTYSGVIEHWKAEAAPHLQALAAKILALGRVNRPLDNNIGEDCAQHG